MVGLLASPLSLPLHHRKILCAGVGCKWILNRQLLYKLILLGWTVLCIYGCNAFGHNLIFVIVVV